MKPSHAPVQVRSLSVKVAMVYGAVVIVSILIDLGIGYFSSIRSIYQNAEERVGTLADSIAYSASILANQGDIFSLQRLVEKSATLQDVSYLAITDTKSIVIAHSQKSEVGKTLDSVLITGAIRDKVQQDAFNDTSISFVLPLRGSSYTPEYQDITGTLWVEMDFQSALERLRNDFLFELLFSVLVMLAMFPVFYLVTRGLIINRLVRFEAGMNRAGSGDLTNPIEIPTMLGSEDEINRLVGRFNNMMASVNQSRQEIQHQRDFALQVMNSMGQGLVILAMDGKVEFANPAFSSLVCAGPEDILGKMFVEFVQPPEMVKAAEALASNDASFTLEIGMMCSNGDLIRALVTAVHRENQSGHILVITDLTERAALEQMKSDFINRASHELRTPLTTAILMVDLLDTEHRQDESAEYWSVLKDAIARQQRLVESLLMLGRIENGRYKVDARPTEVGPILAEVVEEIRQQALSRNLTIDSQYAPDAPRVLGNETALHEVFSNLLSNAVKFSREAGTIHVRMTVEVDGVLVSVKDEGIGIPAEALPNLFTRFFRASNATANEIQGSGLGLYIVKNVIEELGGAIKVQSTLNTGTTFQILLRPAG